MSGRPKQDRVCLHASCKLEVPVDQIALLTHESVVEAHQLTVVRVSLLLAFFVQQGSHGDFGYIAALPSCQEFAEKTSYCDGDGSGNAYDSKLVTLLDAGEVKPANSTLGNHIHLPAINSAVGLNGF